MTRKCGFFDCNNLAKQGKNRCQKCEMRKENMSICSACRQPEPQQYGVLNYKSSFFKVGEAHQFVAKTRDKFPAQFKSEIDQLLPQFKLSAAEKEQIDKLEKIISDFLAEKGGKQDHIDWFNFCSVCEPEVDSRIKDFFNQNPSAKAVIDRIEESGKKMREIWKKIEEVIGQEEMKKIEGEIEEEIYGKPGDKKYGPTGPGNQNDNGNPPKNNQNQDNSAKITQLQQEINSLKQEINNLKNSPGPSPSDPDKIREKQDQLNEKERELNKLKNSPPSTNQPNKGNNSNLPLYIGISIGAVGIIFLIVALIVSQKKKKKTITSLNWQNNWYNR